MANLAAERCMRAWESGKVFTLEHPARSLARNLPSWKKLQSLPGVLCIEYSTCMFEGSRRKKKQVLITNGEDFESEIHRVCLGNKRCDRTGQNHLKWKPVVSGSKVIQFTTGEEREYPVGFCRSYAKAAREILGSGRKFVEIFSGPNAPLSREVATILGETTQGIKSELQGKRSKEWIVEHNRADRCRGWGDQCEDHTQVPAVRVFTAWDGGRNSCLPVGGRESRETTELWQKDTSYPGWDPGPSETSWDSGWTDSSFRGPGGLEGWPSRRYRVWKKISIGVQQRTVIRRLAQLRVLSKDKEILARQSQLEELASDNARQLGLKPRVALLEEIGRLLKVEDTGVPLLCVKGMTIVGPALESPFFEEFTVPPSI